MNLDTAQYLAPLRRPLNPPLTGANIVSAPPAAKVIRAIFIHALTPEENEGGHNVYVDFLDTDGSRIGASDQWYVLNGWADMRPDEQPEPAPFEKPAPEPVANVSIHGGAAVWVQILSYGDSDRVTGLTAHEGHSSWYVVFQFQEPAATTPPVDVGYVLVSKKELRELKAELEQLHFVTAKEVKVIDGWLLRK